LESLGDIFEKKNQKIIIPAYFIVSLLIFFGYTHFISWGPYAYKVPLLKAKEMTGIIDSKGYTELAEACAARGRARCAKQAYFDIYAKNKDIEGVAMLAQLEARNHEASLAVKDFDFYFKNGGKNPTVSFQYALALEQVHDYANALRFLKASARDSNDKLAINVNASILRILMTQQKYVQAHNFIENFWSKSEVAKAYFNTEAAQIRRELGPQKTAGLGNPQARL
jgi:predicted transposase YbfD/YdcC